MVEFCLRVTAKAVELANRHWPKRLHERLPFLGRKVTEVLAMRWVDDERFLHAHTLNLSFQLFREFLTGLVGVGSDKNPLVVVNGEEFIVLPACQRSSEGGDSAWKAGLVKTHHASFGSGITIEQTISAADGVVPLRVGASVVPARVPGRVSTQRLVWQIGNRNN